jgi:TRAP-type C4-dicarboxylate transport system permease small subunit
MKLYSRVNNFIWQIIEEATLVFFSIMLLLAIAQILFRYVLNISVPWTEEAARWLFVWQIFLGSSLMLKEHGHLKITMVRDLLPYTVQKVVDLIMSLLGLIFIIGIFFGSLQMIGSVQNVTAGSFSLSVKYMYLVVPISMVLMVLVYGRRVFQDVITLFRKNMKIENNKE